MASKHLITLRLIVRLFTGGTLLVGILFSARSPMAQKVDPPPAISLDFRCPTYPVSGVQPLSLVADVLGTEDREIVRPLVFHWSISRGKIASGQGTPEITVADLGTTRNDIKIDLAVQGGPPDLGNEKSCSLRVDPQCLVKPRIDQYGGISIDEEQQHLDRFADTLKASPPDSIGYIFSYAGRSACIYEAGMRGKRSIQYLLEKHDIPTKRLILVDGGFRDAWTVELFIQPNAACGPLASPTRKRVEVHVSGRCGY